MLKCRYVEVLNEERSALGLTPCVCTYEKHITNLLGCGCVLHRRLIREPQMHAPYFKSNRVRARGVVNSLVPHSSSSLPLISPHLAKATRLRKHTWELEFPPFFDMLFYIYVDF